MARHQIGYQIGRDKLIFYNLLTLTNTEKSLKTWNDKFVSPQKWRIRLCKEWTWNISLFHPPQKMGQREGDRISPLFSITNKLFICFCLQKKIQTLFSKKYLFMSKFSLPSQFCGWKIGSFEVVSFHRLERSLIDFRKVWLTSSNNFNFHFRRQNFFLDVLLKVIANI